MGAREVAEVWDIGPFRLEPGQALLTRGGRAVPITPKVLETLVLLVRNAGRVTPRATLLEALWPDTVVSEANLKQNVWAARRALAPEGAGWIEAVPKIGYRFMGPARREAAAREVPGLPNPLTSFMGRARETAALAALLARRETRLVTVTGAGGTGKTRLAVEAARAGASAHADGALWVSLAPVAEPELVVSTLAKLLGVEEDAFRPTLEAVKEALRARDVLLVFDNFEHLLPAAEVLTEILRAAPRVQTLVTSRALLRVSGEHEFPLEPLPVPASGTRPPLTELAALPSVALFEERGRAANPAFSLTEANADAVAAICARLDGLPLALELAAVRLRSFPPDALLAQLDRSLDVLTSGPRDVEERQRTLRAALTWSRRLLSDADARLFRGLSLFAGAFRAEAASAVAGADATTGLESLVSQSLVVPRPSAGAPRFFLLETVREFAREELAANGDAEGARDRHAMFFAEEVARAAPQLHGPDRRLVLDALEAEHDDLRAALRRLEIVNPARFLAMAARLGPFWHQRGYWEESLEIHRRALALAPAAPQVLRAAALLNLGRLNFFLGLEDEARRQLEEGLALARGAGDPGAEAGLLEALAQSWQKVGEDAKARAALEEAIPRARASDPSVLAEALATLGAAHALAGEHAEAARALGESVALARARGDALLLARALYYCAGLGLLTGDLASAARADAEARASESESGDTAWSSHLTEMRGRVLTGEGRLQEAAVLVGASLEALADVGSHACLPHGLEAVARLLLAREGGDAAGAARLLGAAEATCDRLGIAMLPVERALFVQTSAAARERLGEGRARAARDEGRGWDTAEAVRRSIAALSL